LNGGKVNTISVLLVDDNLTFLRIATRFLRTYGDIVANAFSDGEEALAQVRALEPDIVLIDLSMHNPSGLKTIPRLRAELPQAGIIALTLLDTNDYREAVLAAGADDLVSKAALCTDLLPAIWRTMQTDHSRGPVWLAADSGTEKEYLARQELTLAAVGGVWGE
jgi:DNA-binding NarL/FixJ family response regulator